MVEVRTRRMGDGSARQEEQALQRGIDRRAPDAADREINRAAAEERPARLDVAFPSHPRPVPKTGNYQHEHRLKLCHRLLMRNIPLDMIAQQLKITVQQVVVMRVELRNRLRNEAKNVDTYSFFGRTLAFYDEVRATGLRMSGDTSQAGGMTARSRISALAIALAAENAKHRFLDTAGFFDHNRFAPPPAEIGDSVESGRKRLGLMFDAVRQSLNGSEDTSYTLVQEENEHDDDLEIL